MSELIDVEVHDRVLVLTIGPAHIQDADLSYALRDQLIAQADAAQRTNVVVDFSRVNFLGSIGLLALMSLRRHLAGGRIIVCGLNETLSQMFLATRLIARDASTKAVFECTDTATEAVLQLVSEPGA